MPVILHIASREQWQRALRAGFYEAPSLAEEGFIHCSTPEQVLRVADALFRGERDLVLLVIDPEHVAAELVYEAPEEGEEPFPHLYGPLELEAVMRVLPFEADEAGRFSLPADVG